MNLIFNAESLRPPITGVGNYSFHLLQHLLADSLVASAHCFTGTEWCSGAEQIVATQALKSSQSQGLPTTKTAALQQALRGSIGLIPGTKPLYDSIMRRRFDRGARQVNNAVYHETNFIVKPFSGPTVTTIHDLSHLRFPDYHPTHVLRWLNDGLERSLCGADKIITVSHIVAEELVQYYRVDPRKICTIYEGVDAVFRPRTPGETESVLSRYGIHHGRYVLMVATLEPRKRIELLLEAWALLPAELRSAFPLVLTGSRGWLNADLHRKLARFIDEGLVRHLGYVPATDLPVIYSGAAVFGYPSIYEGFGLPVLEAMSSGVPSIVNAGTSMAEFAGAACISCEADDPVEWQQRLANLLVDEQKRGDWGARGLAKSTEFSWQRCAQETAAVYRTLL